MSTGNEPLAEIRERVSPPRRSGDWAAILDRSDAGSPTLRVTGYCVLFRPPDVGAWLRRHEPQDGDPGELVLDRVLQQATPDPGNPQAWRLAPGTNRVEICYEAPVDAGVHTVRILPDGVCIPVTEPSDPDRPDDPR